jgi:hypothetical protein
VINLQKGRHGIGRWWAHYTRPSKRIGGDKNPDGTRPRSIVMDDLKIGLAVDAAVTWSQNVWLELI